MSVESPKVLIHSPYPLRNDTPDGVAQFIGGVVEPLRRRDFRVRLVGAKIPEEDRNEADFTFGRTVKLTHGKTTHESAYSFNKTLARNLALTTKPDIVVFHEPLAGHAAHTLLSGMPRRKDGKPIPTIIAQFHAQTESYGLLNRMLLQLTKHVIRRPSLRGLTPGYLNTVMNDLDGRIAVSNATAAMWNDIYPGDYRVIPNGFDTQGFTPEGPIIEKWKNDGKKTLFFAGRHDERKGIKYLIEAFAYIQQNLGRNDIKLKIAGYGDETKNLEKLAQEIGLQDIEFLGILSPEDLKKAYRTSDVTVCPSVGGEGFGRVIAESLASGTPVVASRINGYMEVVNDIQPFARLAEAANSIDLARKIIELIDLPEEKKLQNKYEGRQYVIDNFDWEIVTDRTAIYYRELIEQHETTPPDEWPKKKRKKEIGILGKIGGVIYERK